MKIKSLQKYPRLLSSVLFGIILIALPEFACSKNQDFPLAPVMLLLSAPACPGALTGLPTTETGAWGPVADLFPSRTDVWSIPAIGQLFDTNNDGVIDCFDDKSLVVVSNNSIDANTSLGTTCLASNTIPSACQTGVLRILNARTGEEQYTLNKAEPTSVGFAGVAPLLMDIDGNGSPEIIAVTGESYPITIEITSQSKPYSIAVTRKADFPIVSSVSTSWGWGGGLSVADFQGNGTYNIAYGRTVYAIQQTQIISLFVGTGGLGGTNINTALSGFARLDNTSNLYLLAGKTAYNSDGTIFWNNVSLPDGYSVAVDLAGDGNKQVALVSSGTLYLLNATTGATLSSYALPGTGSGGKPLIADFDGDGKQEIGVDKSGKYTVVKPDNYTTYNSMSPLWSMDNHNLSSSVASATAHDFDGLNRFDIMYADACFFWIFDGRDGSVRKSFSRSSFVSTSAPVISDGRVILPSSGVDPIVWGCAGSTVNGVTWQPSSTTASGAYRGARILSP